MQKLIAEYLDFVKKRSRSSKTHSTYEQALKVFCDTVGDNADLTEETYKKFLVDTATMNPSTQALCRSTIKSLYGFHRINTSFFQQVNKELAVRYPDEEVNFNRAGIAKIIDYCSTIRNSLEDWRDRAFVLFLADTGLRVGEACSLLVGSVDWNECKVSFIGKGGKKATAHVSNRAMDALRDYLRERGNFSKSIPLFIRHDKRVGERIVTVEPGGMWYAFKRRAVEAGVDPKSVRIHDLRHHFITTAYLASKDIRLAQRLARHKKLETTGRYTHFVDDSGKEYDEIFNQ